MSDNKFDNKIADVLKGLDLPYEAGSWDALRTKMDAAAPSSDAVTPTPEQPDFSAFDQKMRASLEQVEMPYQPGHWGQMAQKLDTKASVKRIRLHKAAEVAIVLLLAANFQALLNNGRQWFHLSPDTEPTPSITVPMASAGHKYHHTSAEGSREMAVPALLPILERANVLVSNHNYNHLSGLPVQLAVPDQHNNSNLVASPQTINAALLGADGNPIPKGLRPLTLLAALGLNQLESKRSPLPMAGIMPTDIKRKSKKRGTTPYLMAVAGWSHQKYNGSNQYTTRFNNQQGGLQAGIRKGKWGAETGIVYSNQSYHSDTDIIGFYKSNGRVLGSSYDQIQASVVSIPVKITRRIASFGKGSIQAIAGISTHLTTKKNYTYREIEYPDLPSALSTTQPARPSADGVLENGKVGENAYASLDGGLRFQYQLSNSMALYVEPQYQRFAAGRVFGPQKGRINAVSVQAGVMAAL